MAPVFFRVVARGDRYRPRVDPGILLTPRDASQGQACELDRSAVEGAGRFTLSPKVLPCGEFATVRESASGYCRLSVAAALTMPWFARKRLPEVPVRASLRVGPLRYERAPVKTPRLLARPQ